MIQSLVRGGRRQVICRIPIYIIVSGNNFYVVRREMLTRFCSLVEIFHGGMDLNITSKEFPGFKNVYVVSDPGSERDFVGDVELPVGREFDLLRGDWIPTDKVELRWEMGKNTPGDIIWTTLAVLVIVSKRVITIFHDEGFNGWSTYPVTVYDKAGNTVDGYVGLSVTGRCGNIDNSQSQVIERQYPGGTFPMHRGLYFNSEEWDGSDVFCEKGKSGWIFITEKVAEALRRANIKNMLLERVTDVERSSL
jgi:hypothetical protein